jgi:ABC-type Na+ efflux pump permease subunit
LAVTTKQDKGAFMLSLILPMMIVIMAVMGAFFPAVDLTAGEKERGTSETTLLLPIPRAKVLTGKILACTALAFLATTLNLTSMGLAARHLLGSLGPKVPVEIQFPFMAVLYSLPLILLFCFFVSASLTALAGLTKTFKEGQAMLGPAQAVFMLPAIIGIMPGLELNETWALVPVVNVVLAIRSILVMDSLPLPYLITALSLLASAWLAVQLCIRILSLEALAFAGSSMSLKQLLRRKAR